MSQIIPAILCFIVYLIIYYLVGVLTSKVLKLENNPLLQVLYGMFVYGILFFVYVLPLKFKVVPLGTISVIWAIFIFVLCMFILIKFRDYIKSGLLEFIKSFSEQKKGIILVLVFTISFILFIELYGRIPNGFNQVWFVGWPCTSFFHNELMTYDVEMGTPLKKFYNDRYLCTFLDHSAVSSKLSGLHPMIEVRTVLTAVFVLMQIIIVWELAKYFAKGDKKKTVIAFFMYWIFRNLLVGSQLLPSYYSIFRTYEGKGFVMNVSYPLLLLLLWKMYDSPEDRGWLWKSAIVMFGSMTYSLSMMFSAPFILAAYSPMIFIKKDKRLFRNFFAMGAIALAFLVVYYLGDKGVIDLTIHREV